MISHLDVIFKDLSQSISKPIKTGILVRFSVSVIVKSTKGASLLFAFLNI